MSDEEFIASSSDEENRGRTCSTSKCVLPKWKQGKGKKSEFREEMKLGHFLYRNAVKNLQNTTTLKLYRTVMPGAWKCIATLKLLHRKY